MMGKPNRIEPKLFYPGLSVDRRIPPDYPLRRIKNLIDFTFARAEVEGLYGKNGNESIDPAVILKLMFLLFYENIKSERVLASQLPLRLDWLWFCDYDIDDTTPNHSVISKARSRWGVDVFTRFFENVLGQCVEAGLVDGRTIHIDSSTIDANASKDRLRPKFELIGKRLYQQLDGETDKKAELNADKPGTKVTEVDPDARLFTKNGKTTLGYKDHRVIDDNHGIITATVTTPANIRDDKVFTRVIEEHIVNTGIKPDKAAADKGYGYTENYSYLHSKNILPCIPHRNFEINTNNKINKSEFVYDQHNDCYICPMGKTLKRLQIDRYQQNVRYIADRKTCEQCEHFEDCVSSATAGRTIKRKIDAALMEWADNCLSAYQRRKLITRRRYRAEGSFADAANNHGFKRARWRRLAKMQMQNLLIATIQNLRKLLRYIGGPDVTQVVQDTIKAGFDLISARIYLLIGHLIVE
jgi:transposase